MNEADLKTKMMKELARVAGSFFWRQGSSMYSRSGVADILGVHNGKFVAIEVKLPGKKETPNQARFGAQITAAGGVYVCLTSVEELRSFLLQLQGQ